MADAIDNVVAATELWDAAYNGDVAKLQKLIADPTYKDLINYNLNPEGHSALFFACYGAASAETVRVLLNAGADAFQVDNNGHLPLHFAANSLNSELIIALLEVPGMNNVKHTAASGTGQTPLHALFLPGLAANIPEDKTINISKCLPFFLERDKNPLGALHAKDHNGLSPLMLVKHYNLHASFYEHVSQRTFGILLKSVSVPGNIEELLQTASFCRIGMQQSTETMAIKVRPRP